MKMVNGNIGKDMHCGSEINDVNGIPERKFIHITGIVQGVGFRPFVYQQATRLKLAGTVINDSEGVKVDVQGEAEIVREFINRLSELAPPLSRIDQISVEDKPLHSVDDFTIEQSRERNSTSVCLSPDQGLCDACLAEVRDPSSRFYHYPFTNCTHCGPRYTIIKSLPYDRVATTMRDFALCQPCKHAYQNPLDRRYHAQPISCTHCGPQIRYVSFNGIQNAVKDEAIERVANVIRQGGVIAIKGLGGFHLACDARNLKAVARLRELKKRRRKPLAVMVSDCEMARSLVHGDEQEWQTLQSQAKPIVLMRKHSGFSSLANNVAASGPYLGVMLPYTPLHALLFDLLDFPVVLTSANRSGMPITTEFDEVKAQLGGLIDGILDHNRPILHACDDSVVHIAGSKARVLRMARGYAPYSQHLSIATGQQSVLALGAQQKASIGLALPQQWIMSPYVGDIDDIDTQQRYLETIDNFESLYRVKPSTVVCDKHPGYVSTRVARDRISQEGSDSESESNLIQVQHHHAHILSVMAEHQLTQTVLGFAFDGTGWGDDETVWGGEVLLANTQQSERVCHLRPFRLIGGEKAIRQPARLVLAMLLECYELDEIKLMRLGVFNRWSESEMDNLYQLWRSGNRSPFTSSMGRLIDAWTALLELVDEVDYEGECGLLLEQAAHLGDSVTACGEDGFSVTDDGVIDWQPLLEKTLHASKLNHSEFTSTQIQNFSIALLDAIAVSIKKIASSYSDYPVVLSGGVFQNRILLNRVHQLFSASPQPLYCGETIPVNDGGLAAGQLWYAIHHDAKA
ncbi:hydrogenase metallocenter (NiFe) assembly protein HypF [Photobacterium marinum]|uniref:Carbamoyltransferase HypF n=1 Tax=Photobacterium marinum TaxID=1056511 RepID=L8J6P8_9GAMM|nr:carbamoyltransferase HypF [Photobacterium marinum]ELR63863.1 hydrogenase metallocenter (NiFe) assembly protein HypF [Photobacterium marinum]